jgi:hypothetical protein
LTKTQKCGWIEPTNSSLTFQKGKRDETRFATYQRASSIRKQFRSFIQATPAHELVGKTLAHAHHGLQDDEHTLTRLACRMVFAQSTCNPRGRNSGVALILAFGKDRRSQREGVHVQDGPMDFPTAMPPADSKPGEINYFVPAGDTSAALHSLVLMAHAPCSTLKGVVNAIVITRRRPNGIRYSMKSFRANDECMDILSLYVPESDALGCRYHAKLRQDLIHGAQRTLDVKLEYADGSVNELKNLSVYKSA